MACQNATANLEDFSSMAPYRYIVIMLTALEGTGGASVERGKLATFCLGEEAWYAALQQPYCTRHDEHRRYFAVVPRHQNKTEKLLLVDAAGARVISEAFKDTYDLSRPLHTSAVELEPATDDTVHMRACTGPNLRSGASNIFFETRHQEAGYVCKAKALGSVRVKPSPNGKVKLRHKAQTHWLDDLGVTRYHEDLQGYVNDADPLIRPHYAQALAELVRQPYWMELLPFETLTGSDAEEEEAQDSPMPARSAHPARPRSRSRSSHRQHRAGPSRRSRPRPGPA